MEQDTYMQDSLELNLFYLRIMKEHALFLQLGFTPKNKSFADKASDLKKRLNELFGQAIQMSKGYVSRAVMESGELFTRYTEEAERQTQYFTGVPVDTQLTLEEYGIGGGAAPPASMQPAVDELNAAALSLTRELLQFKERVRNDVMTCEIFTMNYPLVLEHIIAEARNYIGMLERLNSRRLKPVAGELAGEEAFWNENMQQHAQFIDGLLDPTEKSLKRKAREFSAEFERLNRQAYASRSMLQTLPAVTRKSAEATERIINFEEQGTAGILSCRIRSIIIPLLSDHQLREANYYLRILYDTMG